MSEFVEDCPRCGSQKITFDLLSAITSSFTGGPSQRQRYEAFCVCRNCGVSTTFRLSQAVRSQSEAYDIKYLPAFQDSVNNHLECEGYISLKDKVSTKPPKHLPNNIEAAFKEGAICMSVNCFNAAATMFRLCLDFATKKMLPKEKPEELNSKQFRNLGRSLGYRLEWLFDNDHLPDALRDLSTCIKDDGNDGAHQGNLKEADALDHLDFTFELLKRLYTEPEKLRIAKERRATRRQT